MRIKLAFLYTLLVCVLLCGAYALFQCFPQPQEEEEPYEYASLQPVAVQVPNENNDVSGENKSVYQYDFDALTAQNEDFIGWLLIPDTEISFPVVLGDDNDYYLNHSFSKSYSAYGCPFLDTRTPPDGENLVIHGHNMGNNRKEIFSTLLYFQDSEYAKAHNTLYFTRPDREGDTYDLFAVVNVDVKDESRDYIRSSFETEEERTEFLSAFQEHSLYVSDDIPEGEILILSTCNRAYGKDNRLLFVAVERK